MRIAFFTSAQPREPIGLNFGEKMMPLGVGFLLTILKEAGYGVDFYDRYLTKDLTFPDKDYDFVCIYSNTPCFEDTMRIIRHYRHKTDIVVGGPHTKAYPESIVGVGVKYIVQQEGENCIIDIIEGLGQGIILYPRITDLNTLPRPDYKLFSTMQYHTKVKWFPDNPVYNYNSSRGCPHNCAFCDVRQIWGRKWTAFSAERVVSDIEWLIKDFGIKGIYFREDNFTCSRQRIIDICALILKRGIKIKWLCETRVDALDDELVELMSMAGCHVFYIGFESGSQRMLDIYNKGTTVEQGLRVAKWAYDYDIKIAGSFITDHPYETGNDKLATTKFINETKLSTAWMNKYRLNFDNLVKRVMDVESLRSNGG